MSGEITIVQGAQLDEQQIVDSPTAQLRDKSSAGTKKQKGHADDVQKYIDQVEQENKKLE